MSETENKVIKLPKSGKEATVRQYITAGLYMDLQEIPFNKRIKPTVEALVIEFDGNTENVYDRIRKDLHASDFMLIEKNIVEILQKETGENEEEKKK